jgi:hypothetical protein
MAAFGLGGKMIFAISAKMFVGVVVEMTAPL